MSRVLVGYEVLVENK